MKDPNENTQSQSALSAEQTRAALVRAALQLFGSKGFEATSTREIASAANANIGSIAYHFGNKDGLRLAAADHIVETIQGVAGQALGAGAEQLPVPTREVAREMLAALLERMAHFIMAEPHSGEIVQFILRELARPTAALDRIYSGVFEPTHRRLCALWQAATGEPAESEAVRLTVFTLIGQAVYFRIGREPVRRRMGWNAIGAAETAAVAAVLRQNLMAIFAAKDASLNGAKGETER